MPRERVIGDSRGQVFVAGHQMKLLSIIIPFFNSEAKCHRILETITRCEEEDIEFILIDDGSADTTLNLLKAAQTRARCWVRVVEQENRGPGGARNSGLDCSAGEYIWFVDSDDDVVLDSAIEELRTKASEGYDFIDFQIHSSKGVHRSMDFHAGEFSTKDDRVKKSLLIKFGRLWSKVFNRRVFDAVHLRYPEYCIFEDNPLAFVLPFLVNRFLISDRVVYLHDETLPSVTRGKRSYRYFDRMFTAVLGYEVGLSFCGNSDEYPRILAEKFFRLYFWNTNSVERGGPKAWGERIRVISRFRSESRVLGLSNAPLLLAYRRSLSLKGRLLFECQWLCSFFLPCQKAWFEAKRQSAWGKPFSYKFFVDINSKDSRGSP